MNNNLKFDKNHKKFAVIFDLDGTLLNSLSDLSDSCNETLRLFNFPEHKKDEYKLFVGDGVFKLIERCLPYENRDKKIIEQVKEIYDKIYKKNCLNKTIAYEGINELLNYLKNTNIKTAVVSNKPHDFTERIVNHFFNNKIDVILGQSANIPKKPDPTGVLKAIEILNVNLENTVYIGDSDVDIIVSNNAKIDSIGAAWGFRGENELKNAGCKHIAEKPSDIINIFL